MSKDIPRTDGPQQPGDNPNARNAQARQSVRPKRKNNQPASAASVKLSWIDPLPQVEVAQPLGFEPNPDTFPAGEIDLDFSLPTHISKPFSDLVRSVGDRIQMDDDAKEECDQALTALSYFKCSRQLYSTMLDHEKSFNQPLKAVYYDETPIPTHMAGAISIVGHIDTKLGKVLVRNSSTLFKRWIAHGLQVAPESDYLLPKRSGRNANTEPRAHKLVWPEEDGRNLAHRLAREKIAELTNLTYEIDIDDSPITVSMPRLTTQALDDYYAQINDHVPEAEQLRDLVALLEMSLSSWKDKDIGRGRDLDAALTHLELVQAPDRYLAPAMRVAFEEWIANYTLSWKARIEAILKTGTPPAGSSGYGAQTVSSEDTVARWQYPLSDADVNIGFLFSPMKYFNLAPRIVGYSRRDKRSALAAFAQKDGKAFV